MRRVWSESVQANSIGLLDSSKPLLRTLSAGHPECEDLLTGRNERASRWHDSIMGVVVHPGRLRLELARRAWSAADLAREAGISPPTVSAALAGRAISTTSLARIAACLARVATLPAIDGLILGDREEGTALT